MNDLVAWALGILGTIVMAMGAAWAVMVMRKLEAMDKKIEILSVDVATYSGDVRLADVTTSAKITALVIRIENGELRIKAIETKIESK